VAPPEAPGQSPEVVCEPGAAGASQAQETQPGTGLRYPWNTGPSFLNPWNQDQWNSLLTQGYEEDRARREGLGSVPERAWPQTGWNVEDPLRRQSVAPHGTSIAGGNLYGDDWNVGPEPQWGGVPLSEIIRKTLRKILK